MKIRNNFIVSYKLIYGTGTYFQALDYIYESNAGIKESERFEAKY